MESEDGDSVECKCGEGTILKDGLCVRVIYVTSEKGTNSRNLGSTEDPIIDMMYALSLMKTTSYTSLRFLLLPKDTNSFKLQLRYTTENEPFTNIPGHLTSIYIGPVYCDDDANVPN